jgi:hypothetical protein
VTDPVQIADFLALRLRRHPTLLASSWKNMQQNE